MREGDIERIKQIIEEVKPQHITFGGDVKFLDIKDDVVRLKVVGYCYR
jgi:Fe-S cluster biogenesis protein NfuA